MCFAPSKRHWRASLGVVAIGSPAALRLVPAVASRVDSSANPEVVVLPELAVVVAWFAREPFAVAGELVADELRAAPGELVAAPAGAAELAGEPVAAVDGPVAAAALAVAADGAALVAVASAVAAELACAQIALAIWRAAPEDLLPGHRVGVRPAVFPRLGAAHMRDRLPQGIKMRRLCLQLQVLSFRAPPEVLPARRQPINDERVSAPFFDRGGLI